DEEITFAREQRRNADEEIAFPHEEKQNADEEITFAREQRRNADEEIAFPDFRRAVFEGLKDPQNNNGRCGSVRLTRPFRDDPNRCPVRDSSQKERPTLEFFSRER